MKIMFNTVAYNSKPVVQNKMANSTEQPVLDVKNNHSLPISYNMVFGGNKIDVAKVEKVALKSKRDWGMEFYNRVNYIKNIIENSKAKGVVYGNSGGKDCTLVGILSKAACEKTIGVIMPCASKRNHGEDKRDALAAAKQYNIETRMVNLTPQRNEMIRQMEKTTPLTSAAISNIAPRLRMTTLYAIAQSEGCLVAGTGNKSERYMGYFTKHGDGACDFNPISDLTATEVIEFLKYLKAPENITTKAPSAGLFEGQTDEKEMGVTYKAIDKYLETGKASNKAREIIERYHSNTEHKRQPASTYEEYAKINALE